MAQKAGFEPFSTPRIWNVDCPSPSHPSAYACTGRCVSLAHVHPTFCQWKADKISLWLTHLCPQEEGISLLMCMVTHGWGIDSYLPCSKSNKCQQCTMKCPRNLGPDASTLPACWLIYHCMQRWDLTLEWNSDRAGTLMAESKSAGSHFTSRKMKRLLFLAKTVFWTSGLWKQ